ncbi:MAG: hypothetical protein AAF943_15835 [Pseudomonadota bacterium]
MAENSVDAETKDGPPQSFNELIGMILVLNARIDALWQRVIYAHAAMVGVMVFFAAASDPFVIARGLVLLFYTMNSFVTYIAFRDSYGALNAAVADLKATGASKGKVFSWAQALHFSQHTARRAFMLAALWLIIAYLLIGPLIGLF